TVRGKRHWVDYSCTSGMALLDNLRRTGLWRIGSCKETGPCSGSIVAVRRAFLGVLPPPLRRQDELAIAGLPPARRLPGLGANAYPDWVRQSLPGGEWMRVRFASRSAVLRRVHGRWIEASAYRPYCTRLPAPVRRQLFTARECGR